MVVATAVLIVNWSLPAFNGWLFTAGMAMAISVSVMAHNHNHLRMWRSKTLNVLTDYWLTVFYGFPVFAWIPTHNQNHHRLNNRSGDYTATWRLTERNHLFMLLAYPTVSGFFQQKPIGDYLKKNWRENRKRFAYNISQYVVLVAFIGTALWIDWKKALLFVVLPQQFALFTVLVFNYLQHVGADEESEWDHSRNFTSPLLNLFLFNNGFHSVHHWRAGTHWSKTARLHREMAHRIDPSLNEPSMAWYIVRTYLLAPFVPAFRVPSMRLARLESEKLTTPGRIAPSSPRESAAPVRTGNE